MTSATEKNLDEALGKDGLFKNADKAKLLAQGGSKPRPSLKAMLGGGKVDSSNEQFKTGSSDEQINRTDHLNSLNSSNEQITPSEQFKMNSSNSSSEQITRADQVGSSSAQDEQIKWTDQMDSLNSSNEQFKQKGPERRVATPKRAPSPRKMVLYSYFKAHPWIETTYATIHKDTGVSYGSLRRLMKELEAEGVLEIISGGGRPQEVKFVKEHPAYEQTGQIKWTDQMDSLSSPNEQIKWTDRAGSLGSFSEQFAPIKERARKNERMNKINHSFNWGWSSKFIQAAWPSLFQAGLTVEILEQAGQHRSMLDKPWEKSQVVAGLDRIEWELTEKGELHFHGGKLKGQKVDNLVGFFIRTLKDFGTFLPHPEYVSAEDVALKLLEEELEKTRKAKAKRERLQALIWWEEQPEEVRESVRRRCGSFAKKEEDQAMFGFKKRAEFEVQS